MVKKLSLLVSMFLFFNFSVDLYAMPARRFMAEELQRRLNQSLVHEIRNDALTGGMTAARALQTVVSLCAQGAQVNADPELKDEAPLTIAVWYSTPEIVKFLLEMGADCNYQERNSGITAMHVAAGRETLEFVSILDVYGALLNEKDFTGRFPIEYAARMGLISNVIALANNGAIITQRVLEDVQRHATGASSVKERNELCAVLRYLSNHPMKE